MEHAVTPSTRTVLTPARAINPNFGSGSDDHLSTAVDPYFTGEIVSAATFGL